MKTKFFRKNCTGERRKVNGERKNPFSLSPFSVLRCYCLLVLLTATFCAAAQNGVTVSNLSMDAGTVTFKVSWDKNAMPVEMWSDSVWVWVDYNNAGTMTRLPLLPGATLTDSSWDNAEVIEESGNNKGVWVVGNAKTAFSGSFSATVQLLTDAIDRVYGAACAYASNYPPVGQYIAAGTIRFTGTPPYYLAYSAGGAATVTREQVEGDYALTYPLASFTDATGAPGVVRCLPPALQTLTASASGFCAGTAGVTFALSGTQDGATYQLYLGTSLVDTLAGTGSAATFTNPFASAGVYTAQVAAENGYCAAAMSGSQSVSENPLPVATASASTICFGATAACYATLGAGTTSAMTYTWNIGGNSSTTTGNSKTSEALTASTSYTVQLRNDYGCVGAVSSPATITVIALPEKPSVYNNSRCGTGSVVLSASSPGAVIDWYDVVTNGNVLANGTATSTFTTPSISTSTTYYALSRYSATRCVSAERTAVSATINTVPGAPTTGGGGSQCGGTMSITATAAHDGTGIRWTDGSSTISPRSVGSGTYYAVTTSAVGCESGTASVSVTINAVPTIARSGGAASQSVYRSAAISAITYTASNATSISQGGILPNGVTSSINGTTLTINGAPSATGTFGYTVSGSHTNGCVSTLSAGTITVSVAPLLTAASTQTWSYGGLIWSDRVNASPSACAKCTLPMDEIPAPSYDVFVVDGSTYTYYNRACVYASSTATSGSQICPAPWRTPNAAELNSLKNAPYTYWVEHWGYGGFVEYGVALHTYTIHALWPASLCTDSYCWVFSYEDSYYPYPWPQHRGALVRCVQ